ncbi:hypothetical protein [Bradyrhizobium sp. Arg816]|nr:hypothetical protein [Bradyrhizobium sp. Arg816]MDI3559555.1 hypothetical protein [Bradyrhizobium sp. Arg816]
MKLSQIMVDAAAIRGELRDVLTAGLGVTLCLAIAWAVAELRKS